MILNGNVFLFLFYSLFFYSLIKEERTTLLFRTTVAVQEMTIASKSRNQIQYQSYQFRTQSNMATAELSSETSLKFKGREGCIPAHPIRTGIQEYRNTLKLTSHIANVE